MSTPEIHPALDWASFRHHLQIKHRYKRGWHSFGSVMNVVQQEKLYAPWHQADVEGRPFRAIVVKARQMGFSTAIRMRFLHRACVWRNISSLTVAHLDATTIELHNMAEGAYLRLPGPLRPRPTPGGGVGHTLRFAHDSSIRTWTAGTREIARGWAIWQCHLSEGAYYADLVKGLDAVRQAVPDEPGTALILESTANGMEEPFHREWMQAIEGENEYLPIFAGWHEYPFYRRAERLWPKRFADELTDEELELQAAFSLDLEQLAWRRFTLANKCRGDIDILHQEYPATWEEAFIASGLQYFKPQLISNFANLARKTIPARIGRLEKTPAPGGKSEIVLVPDESGPLIAYETPRPGHRYAIFADCAGDVGDDELEGFRDVSEAQDYNVGWCINLRTLETAAVWSLKCDIDVFGQELALFGWLYNYAQIAPERTGGYGLVVIRELREQRYRRLYVRRALDTQTGRWTEKIGWETTDATRPLMLENLRQFLRDHPERLKDLKLAQEMTTFLIGKRRRPAASPGAHDDRVMACAGALELAAENPQPSTKAERQAKRLDREKRVRLARPARDVYVRATDVDT